MQDLDINMRRTDSGLLVPDHVISTEPGEQLPEKPPEPEKPKSTPSSVLKLNRAMRRKLGKPWQGRKMAQDLARREARPVQVTRKERKVRGCAEDCPCRQGVLARGGAER